MRSTRKQIYLSVAVGLGLASMQHANAGYIDMDASSPTPVKYAQEINIEGSAALTANAASGGGDFSVKVTGGVGATGSSTAMFYRLDLSNAKFGSGSPVLSVGLSGAPAVAAFTAAGSAGSSGVGTLVGGGAGQTSAVYNVTANTSGIATSSIVYVTFSSAGAVSNYAAISAATVIPATKAPVKLKFRAFASQGEANSGTNALNTKEITIIDFTPTAVFTVGSKSTTTVSAPNSFGQFDNGFSNNQLASVGNFSVTSATTILSDGTSATDLSSVTSSSANALVVKGNFSTMQSLGTSAAATTGAGLFIGTTSACSTAVSGTSGPIVATPVASSSSTSGATVIDSVKFTNIPASGLGTSSTPVYLCYTDTSGTGQPIQESTYTIQFTPTAATNFVAQSYPATEIGMFKRTGTELQASFVAGTAVAGPTTIGGVNRFVFTNTGSSPATIVAARLLDGDNNGSVTSPTNLSGTALTIPAASSVIPANGNLAIQVADIMPATVTKRSTVVFTIGASTANIKGTYQLLMPGANVQTVTQMVGPNQSN